MTELIVQTDIVSVGEDGERHPMTIEIGKPYPVGDDFACHVALRGLHDHIAPILGVDQMQALTLALSMVKANLTILQEKGYKILFPDDVEEDISVTEIWFSGLENRGDPNQALHRTK